MVNGTSGSAIWQQTKKCEKRPPTTNTWECWVKHKLRKKGKSQVKVCELILRLL